jgi:hypothetical protein
MLPEQLLYHVDPDTGRELIINGWNDGIVQISIYRSTGNITTRYAVDLPPDQVAELAAALTAYTEAR